MEDTTTKPKSEVIIITDSEDDDVGTDSITNHFYSPSGTQIPCALTQRQALEKVRSQLMKLKERRSSADY
ncbi:hypothetical protein ACFFRR_000500 [Megaselia abdita]